MRGRWGLRCVPWEAGLGSDDLSWTALKLKAMPATRCRVRRGAGRQQHSRGDKKPGKCLENVFFLPVGAHGEKGRGDDHRQEYQGKNQIVDHWGDSPLGRRSPSLSHDGAVD